MARVLAAGACVSALAACSSSTGNKTSGTLPPKAVQTEVAASVASSISSEIKQVQRLLAHLQESGYGGLRLRD
jgi:hypothetical protein